MKLKLPPKKPVKPAPKAAHKPPDNAPPTNRKHHVFRSILPSSENERKAVPSLWQTGAAGVHLEFAPGPGQKALERVCNESGWTYGIVTSYVRENENTACTAVLVGVVLEGRVERATDMGSKAWDQIDQALMQVAQRLKGDG